MERVYLVNSTSSENIHIPELHLTILGDSGVVDLFKLNPAISSPQLEFSLTKGTLNAAVENGLVTLVTQPIQTNITVNSNPRQIQVFTSRVKFAKQEPASDQFNDDVLGLTTEEDKILPARELAVLKPEPDEKAIAVKKLQSIDPIVQEKLRNDLKMGYITCGATNSNGSLCKRAIVKDKKTCSIHAKTKNLSDAKA